MQNVNYGISYIWFILLSSGTFFIEAEETSRKVPSNTDGSFGKHNHVLASGARNAS